RQPEQIVRKARAHAAAGGLVPPVQHVTFWELARGGLQNLRARYLRLRVNQRHHVLQLVAKTKRPARLIESRSSADTARQGLIEQPTIDQSIHRGIRRSDFDSPKCLVPEFEHGLKGFVHLMQVAKTRVDLARLFDRFSLTQKKNYFSRFAGREFKARLDRRAGIEPGAVTSAQARAPQRCRAFQAAIASYEFITVTSHREAAF